MHSNKLYFGNEELETVGKFSYLGFLITPSLSIKKLLNDLYKRGLKAYFKMKNCLGETFKQHIQVTLKLFDSLVKPILLYGIDFRGCFRISFNDQNPVEKLHLKLCKEILGVKKTTSNIAARCELGRQQLFIVGFQSTVKNWIRLVQGQINSILRKVYIVDRDIQLPWTTHMKNILFRHGVGYTWETQFMQNKILNNLLMKQVITRIIDCNNQCTIAALEKQSKMRTYCTFKTQIMLENYLLNVKNLKTRIAVSKFRLSDHRLEIETGRYHRLKNRLCSVCNEVENEMHCLMTW